MNLRLQSLVPLVVSFLFGIVLLTSVAEAMDWETAVEVASCPKRPDFEKDGDHALAILRQHNILAKIVYYLRRRQIEALATDPKHSTRWAILVNVRNAAEARQVLAPEIARGLRITLVP